MQSAIHNKVKVYNLTSGKSLPEWLAERKQRKSIGDEQRVELLHEFEFPHFARCLFLTPNGTNIFAAGDYPPRLKCFDVNQLSMKYSFNADIPIISGVSLSPDFRKFALRGDGRDITVHHSAVIVDRLRVPHTQRCLEYHENTCDLLSGGTSDEILRFNLDVGSFIESFKTRSPEGVNSIDVFKGHGLIIAGCENGVVEAWDSRADRCASATNIGNMEMGFGSAALGESCSVTHITSERSGNGLLFCCGTSIGQIALYDIRLNKPLLVNDHKNSLPIVKTYFFNGKTRGTAGAGAYILSADTRSIKVWNKGDGSNFTTLEAPADIYDFVVFKSQHNLAPPYECDDSGIVAICCDTPKIQVQFIPQLGISPKWASFLDSITEELEEKAATVVYDDYRFITKEEMGALGISSKDVTDGRVRPAMHGCYIENGLYRDIKAVMDPSSFNKSVIENSKAKKQARLDSRISKFIKKTPEGEEMMSDVDKRFAAKLRDPAFAVDAKNEEYAKLLVALEAKRLKEANIRKQHDSSQFRVVPRESDLPVDMPEFEDSDISTHSASAGQRVDNGGSLGDSDIGKQMLIKRDGKRGRDADDGIISRNGNVDSRGKMGRDNVIMQEARPGAKFAVDAKQAHEDRKMKKMKKLSLADRMVKMGKK